MTANIYPQWKINNDFPNFSVLFYCSNLDKLFRYPQETPISSNKRGIFQEQIWVEIIWKIDINSASWKIADYQYAYLQMRKCRKYDQLGEVKKIL